MTFGPSWDNMRHVHNSLYMINLTSRVMWPNGTGKNTTKSSTGSQFLSLRKFTTGYETIVLLKEFIAPEQINMSFAFAYMEFQAKECWTQWNLYSPLSSCHFQYFTHCWILLVGFHDCQYLYWKGVPLIWPWFLIP